MSQCVPSWDLDDASAPVHPRVNGQRTHSNSSNSLALDVPSLDYEVAELTWENGQLAMHGLGPPRVPSKPAVPFSPPAKYAGAWEKPRTGTGTLESIVNQATCHVPHLMKSAAAAENNAGDLPPWFDHRRAVVNPGGASMAVTMDALVPCNNRNDHRETSRHVMETSGTCTAARAGMCCCKTNTPSVSESTGTCRGGRERRQITATFDSGERELGARGFTSTSMWSPENTSSGKEYTKTTSGEDHDSVCHSRSQMEGGDDGEVGKKKGNGKSSSGSTKRIRAAAIHNQSERKRRDKINQRMKTLQKLVPNSSKTDKASILDEVIQYLKQLQAQVQMMNRMNIPQMMLPLALQQQLHQMSMMGMGMGMGMMDLNTLSRAAGMPPIIPSSASGMPSVVQPTAAFMPMAPSPWDMQAGDRLASTPVTPDLLSAFLACQSQPMTMDAYKLAALYQQFQQGPGSGSTPGLGSKN